MRVIAGKAGSIPLVTPQGKHTRPTTDRVKETLFNILQPELPGADFLDIFSGSGGMGIEAVSRGAKSAVLIENDRAAIACIRKNIQKTYLEEEIRLFPVDAMQALKSLEKEQKRFDVVFMDPPYDKGMENEVLLYLAQTKLLQEDALVVVESSLHTDIESMLQDLYHVERVKEYKTNRHIFLRPSSFGEPVTESGKV